MLEAPKHLNSMFGVTDDNAVWFEKELFPWFYLNRKMIAARGLSEAAVADAPRIGCKQPWAMAAYTRQQLFRTAALERSARHHDAKVVSVMSGSGDVAVIMKPYYLAYSTKTGTGHNSPHSYDTHVP